MRTSSRYSWSTRGEALPSAGRDFDVVVVGAGPVGANAAALIAKEGFHVALVDNHSETERPIRCGCLVTPRVLDLVDAKKAVIGKVRGAVVYSPKGREIVVDGRKTKAVVLDRQKFDQHVISRAVENGVHTMFGTTAKAAIHRQGDGVAVSIRGNKGPTSLTCNILIGADGTVGNVPGWFSTSRPRKMLLGCEQTLTEVAGDERFVKLFLGHDFAPGFFGWVIPGGGTARVGLCVDHGNVRANLRKMMQKHHVGKHIEGGKPLQYSAGRIPIGFPRKTYASNAMVVGDAACQVKATSGGGIFPGLLCSTFCAQTAVRALEESDFSSTMMRSYQRAWMKAIGKELRRDFAIHESFARLSDNQFEEIFELMDKPGIIELIQQLGDIDFPSKVGWRLLREEPRLLKYAGKALRVLLPRFA